MAKSTNPRRLEKSIRSAEPVPTSQSPKTTKSRWSNVRLISLVLILVVLSVYSFFSFRYSSALGRVNKALVSYDSNVAIDAIKSLEKITGKTADTYFYKARAYRHLGDEIAFLQNADLAKQLGYSAKKIENEKLLRQAQMGTLPEFDINIAKLMADPDVDFDELGSALVYGLLGKQDFVAVNEFLVVWESQLPNSPWIPLFRGMLAISRREWDRAVLILEKGTQANPDFVPFYRNLGAAYNGQQQNEKAVAALRRYLKSMPNDSDAVSMLTFALNALGKSDEVLALLQPAVESGQATIEMRLQVAKIYLNGDEPSKAIETLSSVATIWPEDVDIASIMSQANQAIGNEEAATKFSKVAEAGLPDLQSVDGRLADLLNGKETSAQKCYELGHILLHKQSREEGRHWLNTALLRDESFLPAHEDLVIYYTRTNQPAFAAQHQAYINARRGIP